MKILDRKNIEINPLQTICGQYIKKIDDALESELELYSESEFKDPLKFAIHGGKRIRPLILIFATQTVGKADENAYSAACAVELLHTESVIHDDIIDNETMRRKKEPFHIKYGYNTSILTGDFVLGLILNISSRINNPRITKDLIGIAYQIRDDLIDWKNEDKLFNLLVRKSSDPRIVFNKMEFLLKKYSEDALSNLLKFSESESKSVLEELVKFTSFKE